MSVSAGQERIYIYFREKVTCKRNVQQDINEIKTKPFRNLYCCLLYNCYDVSSENLLLDQLVLPLLIIFFSSYCLSAWYCIVLERRNSVMVTHGSLRVKVEIQQLTTPRFMWVKNSDVWSSAWKQGSCRKAFITSENLLPCLVWMMYTVRSMWHY